MFKRNKPDTWDHKPTQTTVQELEAAAADVYPAMCHERGLDKLQGGEIKITLTDLREVRDRTGAIWYLRKLAMEERDAERAAYILKYRPIQTLDGLDPSPTRLAYRELANGFKVFARARRG